MSGIKAGRIAAINVVQGVQVQGADPAVAGDLAKFVESAPPGAGIEADIIDAENVVSGIQWLAGHPPRTEDELGREIASLKQQLADALRGADLAADVDAEDAREALDKAQTELQSPQPRGNRVVRCLKTVRDILTQTEELKDKAGKTISGLTKLAVTAKGLWEAASALFGG